MATTLEVVTAIAVVAIFKAVIGILLPPWDFPLTIPTVPFYVCFLSTYTKMDQRDIYERYLKKKLEKYGAVKIYFAGRWNILVSKPEYLARILRAEDVFAKSGNHNKIPHAVLSEYTGDNVISAHGETWKVYRNIIQKSVQFPVNSHVFDNTRKFVGLINDEIVKVDTSAVERAIEVGDFLQRLTLANISKSMLGVDFGTLDYSNTELHRRLKLIKGQIFKPLFMNFPFLDQLPIPSRKRTREEVHNFRKYFGDTVIAAARLNDPTQKLNKDSAAFQLYQAMKQGDIDEKQFLDNLVIILVAGHENPQLFFTSLLYVLAKYPAVQEKLGEELRTVPIETLDTAPYLASVIFETLRYLPPLGQIINRCTTERVCLGNGVYIPDGAYVGYNNYATTHSSAWVDADTFAPGRWGNDIEEVMSTYRHAKSYATLPSFHGGKRACLGERFALFESRVFVKEVLENFELKMDPTWEDKLTPSGPICPFRLRVVFKKVDERNVV